MKKTLFTSILALCCAGAAVADTTEKVTYTTSNYVGDNMNGGNYNSIAFNIDSDYYGLNPTIDAAVTSADSTASEAKEYFTSDAALTLDSITVVSRYSTGSSPSYTDSNTEDSITYSVSSYYAYITIDGTTYTSKYSTTKTQVLVYEDGDNGYYTRSLMTFDLANSDLAIYTDTSYTLQFGYTVTATDSETSETSTFEVTGASVGLAADVQSNDWYFGSSSTYGNPGMSITTSALVTIPEPTTATLSLVALAGLMVRRRRQA
ncbi:MAG: PEP-CTERM sorting domain-containing protein [Akkermansia sp.]